METIEHTNCGTPDCCQQCTPIQLELFPVSIYAKDTKQKPHRLYKNESYSTKPSPKRTVKA